MSVKGNISIDEQARAVEQEQVPNTDDRVDDHITQQQSAVLDSRGYLSRNLSSM